MKFSHFYKAQMRMELCAVSVEIPVFLFRIPDAGIQV